MNNTDSQASDAIGVNVFVPTASRGTAYNSTADFNQDGNTFDLFAHKVPVDNNRTREEFMGTSTDGVEFIYDDGWDYKEDSEIRFWKEAKNCGLIFYAVSPANPSGLTKDIGSIAQKFEYTVPTECSNQVDLMYATAEVDVDDKGVPTSYSDGECKDGVKIDFKHALSQILFKAKTEDSRLRVDIASITVENVCSKGSFTFYDFIALSGNSCYWTVPDSGQKTELYTVSLKNNTNIPNTATDISDSPLLLMPQRLSDFVGNRSLKVEFSIYVNGNENNKLDNTLYVPLTGEWKAGYKYTYTLIFSEDIIKIGTVNVDDWTDGVDNETTIKELE